MAHTDAIRLTVENVEFADMIVHLVREGIRIPLGTFDGFTTRTVTIQGSVLPPAGGFVLVAMTRAGSDLVQSPPVTARPGQVVTWRIERTSFGAAVTVR
jgi:hypothetical protein